MTILQGDAAETEAPGSGAPGARPDRLLASRRQVFVLYALWLVPAVIFTGSNTLTQGDADLAAWASNLGRNIWAWLYWATLSPWVYRLLVAVPLTRSRWLPAGTVHVTAALANILGLCLFLAVVRVSVFADARSFFELFVRELTAGPALGRHMVNFCKYWVVLGAMALIWEGRRRRASERRAAAMGLRASRLESRLASATLRLLHVQLNPHFLFNALNSVSSLVEQGQNRRALHMIGVLGAFLRQTLKGPGDQRIPLREELDLVRQYLEIEVLRFGDRLRVEYDVSPDSEDVLVPPLILQPLAENVVRHGVARQVEPVALRIVARAADGDSLALSLADDGPGLPAGWSLSRDAGVGLATTAERLRLAYGERHRFAVSAAARRGVLVSLTLPRDGEGDHD